MKLGQTYRCSVCGAETLVIRAIGGIFRPICCNQPMILLKEITKIYCCPVCGAEVAVLVAKSDSLRLVCCNAAMRILTEKAA